jgi:hypothetical protein
MSMMGFLDRCVDAGRVAASSRPRWACNGGHAERGAYRGRIGGRAACIRFVARAALKKFLRSAD